MTLGQETRWAYSIMLLSPHGLVGADDHKSDAEAGENINGMLL